MAKFMRKRADKDRLRQVFREFRQVVWDHKHSRREGLLMLCIGKFAFKIKAKELCLKEEAF
jgi:hypothetical protein